MHKTYLTAAALLGAAMLSYGAYAQSTAGVDPACLMKNSDGTEAVDMTKCPDGKTVGGAANTTTQTPTAPVQPSTTAADGIIVPTDAFANAKVMSASDFIGKRVYTKAGDDIGEVNDLIVSDNGNVQAVVLGVGGFLGIGEKDVAVRMASIEMLQDGDAVRLVVDGSKEQFTAAPAYDRKTRTYVN